MMAELGEGVVLERVGVLPLGEGGGIVYSLPGHLQMWTGTAWESLCWGVWKASSAPPSADGRAEVQYRGDTW